MYQILKTSGVCDVCKKHGFDLVCLDERVDEYGYMQVLLVGHRACARIKAFKIKTSYPGDSYRYRVVGQCEAEDWHKAHIERYPTEEPYCEMSVSQNGNYLVSYGGSVWPGAWPSLFTPIRATAQGGSGGFTITAAGKTLLASAVDEVASKEWS